MSSSKELKKCSNEKIHFWRHGMVYYFILHILYLKRDTVWWSKDFTWNWLKKNCHYWYICTVVRWLFAKFAWNARIGHTKDGDNKEHWSHNLGLIFTPITFGLLQWMGQTHILCSKSTVQNICGCHQSKGIIRRVK